MKRLALFLTIFVTVLHAHLHAANFTASQITITPGQTAQLVIGLNNTETNLSGFQFKLYLPEGLSVTTNDKGKFVFSQSGRIENHTVTIKALNDGGYLVVGYSMDADVITGSSGELMSISVTADETASTSGNGTLSNIRITDVSSSTNSCTDVSFAVLFSIPATGISLNSTSLTFNAAGQTSTLNADVTPSNASNKSVIWTSSNTSVAIVSNAGVVTAVASGTATITATTADGTNLSATCTVTVNIKATGITLNSNTLSFTAADQTSTLVATVTPSNATNKKVTWTSSNTAVAIVNNTGVVTAVANGTAVITATTADGTNLTAQCTVTVSIPVPATDISLSNTSLTLTEAGQSATLTATVTPSNATNKNVTWTSSNTGVATVSNTGVVTAVADGTTVITATTADGTNLTAQCMVNVNITVVNNITFKDENVKAICVANWDTNGDGELSEAEAAAVSDLGEVFKGNTDITSFDELQYFTGLTSIGDYAFYNCIGLTSITIPCNVTSIGNFAFHGCNNLSSFIIPEGVTRLGNNTFEECLILPSITIPSTVISIGSNAFTSTPALVSIVVEEGNTIYDSRDNCNAIIETETNTLISGCRNTTIPLSVTSIGREAFSGRGTLTSITIPSSVTSIEFCAFFGCDGLTSVTVQWETPLVISSDVFTYNCNSNATLYVPFGCKDAYEAADYWKDFRQIVEIIAFTDDNVKAICIENWDTNHDGELSEAEAAAVTDLGEVFKENTNITSFDELQYFTGLTNIGSGAFQNCTGLASVTIPCNVTSIGSYAFYVCSSLTSITIPNSVTSIGSDAFSVCSSLSSIIVEGDNPKYDSRSNCNAIIETSTNSLIAGCMTTVIPNDVTSIGFAAFSGHSGLTSITIPNSVTSIGDYAFYECGLTSLKVDIDNPLTISWSMFYNCYNATLHVPAGCKAAYEAADYWKEFGTIVEVEAPSPIITFADAAVKALCVSNWDTNGDGELSEAEAAAVTSLGEVFKGNTDITSFDELQYFTGLNLSSSVHFALSTWQTSVKYDNISITSADETLYSNNFSDASLTGWTDNGGQWSVVDGQLCQTSTEMTGNLFTLSNVTLGSSYTIDLDATKVGGMEGFLIGFNVVDNNYYCWWNLGGWTNSRSRIEECIAGVKYEVGNSVSMVIETGRTYHITIAVNDGNVKCYLDGELIDEYNFRVVKSILTAAFEGCSNLASVTMPDNLTTISPSAFAGCSSLTSLTIPSSVTSIGVGAFSGCNGLTSVVIPKSVTSIGSSVFAKCPNISSIIVEDGNAIYDSRNGCNAIIETATNKLVSGCKNTIIPEGIITIGGWAFSFCTGLTSMTIPDGVTGIQMAAFENCYSLNSVTIPHGVTYIDGYAFSYCNNLPSVNIPNSVTTIGKMAFNNCHSLTSIVIPNSVTNIGEAVFQDCNNLTSVKVDIDNPLTIDANTFSNRTNATLTVPYGCRDAYLAADYWKEFGEIVEMAPTNQELQTLTLSLEVVEYDNYKITSTDALDMTAIQALLGTDSPVVYSLGQDGEKTKDYTLDPHPGFWCNAEGRVCHHGDEACRIGYAFVTDHLEVYQKPGWATDLGGNYVLYMYLMNEETGNYVTVETFVHVHPVSIAEQNIVLTTTCSAAIPLESQDVSTYPCHALESLDMAAIKTAIGTDEPVVYAMNQIGYLTKGYTLIPYPGFWMDADGKVCGFGDNPYIGYAFVEDHLEVYQKPGMTNAGDTYVLDIYFVNEATGDCAKHSTTITITSTNAFAESTILPWGYEQPWEMKYVYFDECGNEPSTDTAGHAWTDVEFDDSSWDTLTGPIARNDTDFPVVNTPWETERSCYYLRRTFELNHVNEQGYYFFSKHDDNIKVWINGTQVFDTGYDGKYQYHYIPATAFVEGANTLAIYLDDNGGGQAYLDYTMGVYYIMKNVETGKYLNAGNAYGMHAVLADEPLPVQISRQPDGSYTLFFPTGSQFRQKLYRADATNVYVDYKENFENACPYWTISEAGNGNYYIQSLVTHETYGQEAMPGTFLGNDPEKEAQNQDGTALGVYNDVDGNVTEGKNITWSLECMPLRTAAQVAQLQELITTAQGLGLDTSYAQTVLNNEEAFYLDFLGVIINLQTRINEENDRINKKVEDLAMLIACANVIGVNTDDVQTVADNPSSMDALNGAINTLHEAYIAKLSEGVSINMLPLNITGVILNPSFVLDNAANWSCDNETPQFQSYNNAEYYQKAFDIHQTISGLPNGNYVLKVKGFHRPGSDQDVYSAYQQGIDNASAELYANGEAVILSNQASGAQETQLIANDKDWRSVTYDDVTKYVPGTMHGARSAFDAGLYENELPVTVTDGTLTLGIRLDESVDNGWVIFDDFRLEYLSAANQLYAEENPTVLSGSKTELNISLKNDDEITAIQFTLQLPEGMNLDKVTLNGSRSDGHQVKTEQNSIVCYSGVNNVFKDYDGKLFTITLSCASDVPVGTYQANVTNILMTDADKHNITQADFTINIEVPDLQLGDVNGDGSINVVDIVEVVDYIMQRPSETFHFAAANVHYDQKINALDLVALVKLVLKSMSQGGSHAPALGRSNSMGKSCLRLASDGNGILSLGIDSHECFIVTQCVVEMNEDMQLETVQTDKNHTAVWQPIGAGRYSVVVYSAGNDSFEHNECLLKINCTGAGTVSVSDVLLVDADRQLLYFDSVSTDMMTGIDVVDDGRLAEEGQMIYTIDGRRVSTVPKNKKGVYVVNNKKMVVR